MRNPVIAGRWALRAVPALPAPALFALAILAFGILAVAIGLAVSIGEMAIPLGTIAKAVGNRLLGTGFAISPIQEGIIWDYRLSRALVAACCGAALAMSGAILQALLRNPLAEPYVLGISAGASTGAVAVMIAGLGGGALSMSGGAFTGALLAFTLVCALAAGTGGLTGAGAERIILAGVAGSQLFSALTSYIVTTSANAEQARGVMFWLLGSLGGVRWPDVGLAAPAAIGGIVIGILHARALDAFAFGVDAAAALGIPVTRVRLILFGLTAAMTATMVSIVGSIGFVGLVVPHAARFLVGPGHMRLLPASFLIGAVFMVLADIVSRIVVPQQILPIGVVTALFGAPAFALILYKARRRL